MKSGIFIDVADLCSRKVSTKKGHYRAFPTTLITGNADCKGAGSDSVLNCTLSMETIASVQHLPHPSGKLREKYGYQ
jgi:hypothetical protein